MTQKILIFVLEFFFGVGRPIQSVFLWPWQERKVHCQVHYRESNEFFVSVLVARSAHEIFWISLKVTLTFARFSV